jgi:DNA-binding PadR family transcriptional regulator
MTKRSSLDISEYISDFSRFYILILLYEGPCHGYSIISKFRERIGKEISPSLVYPFLKQLEKGNLIKHKMERIGEKERKVYELTERGREFCTRLFKRFAALISVAIEPSLKICANCGCRIYQGGHIEIVEGMETAFCCKHCAASYKRERVSKSHR